MKKIFLKDLINYLEKEVVLDGFIDNIRNLQYVMFIILRDSTGKVQLTLEKEDPKNTEMINLMSGVSLESTIKVKGLLKESPKVKLNGMELIPSEITVTSKALNDLPFDIKKKDNALRETRLDYRFLDLRREDNQLLFHVQSYIGKIMDIQKFIHQKLVLLLQKVVLKCLNLITLDKKLV